MKKETIEIFVFVISILVFTPLLAFFVLPKVFSVVGGILDSSVIFIFFAVPLILLYFIPGLVASYRKHNNTNAIAVINIFLGWTFLGWVIALAWAFTSNTNKEESVEIEDDKFSRMKP